MVRTLTALTPLLLLSVVSIAEAVQTRNCPESIQLALSNIEIFSSNDVLNHTRHAKYTKDMFEEATTSRDRAEKHLPSAIESAVFTLKKRENGRCLYRIEGPELRAIEATLPTSEETTAFLQVLNSRRVVLYTKTGKNLFREEFQLPYQRRESETFIVETILTGYSPEGVQLSQNIDADLKVTVRYPCYDHRCLSEAIIGRASPDAR